MCKVSKASILPSWTIVILVRTIVPGRINIMSGLPPHPFDPLSLDEISTTVGIVKEAHGDVFFNVVSMHEPRKAEMKAWLENPRVSPRPARIADVVVIAPGGKVYDGLVDLNAGKITHWEPLDGLQPIVRETSPQVTVTLSLMKH